MTFSVSAIYDAIDTQLELIKSAPFKFPGDVALMNITYVPTTGHPYVLATMSAYTRTPLTLGQDSTIRGGYMAQHKGIYKVDCVVPQDAGRTIATRLQDQVLRLFPRGTTLIGSNGEQINFDAATPMPITGQGDVQALDAWLWASVNCPWYSFEAS